MKGPVGLLGASLAALAAVCLAAPDTPPAKDRFTPAQRKYWAFQPVRAITPPANGAANPIDIFLTAKLTAQNLHPNPPADRVTLLRRVSFDLIGLPPTPAEIDAFLADSSPGAYNKVVDRLLASPRYGERWARHWLDLARYAESEGFKSDETRPNAWRYRDYVIQAFNQNKPYDRFIKEQIAGDELWPNDPAARVATAFNRHYPDESNARNLMQRRQEILNDITDTVGATFLAMTYGCARCHDHKFDPILQSDYYRLQAFFANTTADDEIPMVSAEAQRQYRERKAAWEEKTKDIRAQIDNLLEPQKQKLLKEFVDKYPAEIQDAIAKPAAARTPFEWQMYYKAKPYLTIDDDTASKALKPPARTEYASLMAQLKPFADLDPGDPALGIGMRDVSPTAPAIHLLASGAWDAPKEEVQPGFLQIVDPSAPKITPGPNTTGRRTALANWLASASNPLTARVMVNRIWHYHFGQGLAPSPSDFGLMGGRPSNPELLDWLSSEFVRTGWDIKRMHKLIVTSNAYMQSSQANDAGLKADPNDKLLWRFPRQRLEGEVIRDSALYVAGLLNEKMGGPSVFPELPAGAGKPRGGWKVSPPEEQNRRSIYIFVRRNARYPMLEAFDMPDTHESCGRRNQTITAPQAMALLNDATTQKWAEALAKRLPAGTEIETAYRLIYGRKPDGFEKDAVQTFLAKQEKLADHSAALADFCLMLLNSNEFLYAN